MSEANTKFVAYYRVSTKRQGQSGLGLDGQKTAVTEFATKSGGVVAATYTEIESGKRSDRKEFAKAVAHARRSRATLLVAKLDRLSRNVAFLSALMESGADFVACDNPHANKFTIHILAAVAEHEAEQISQRTKAALAAAKARGTKLGSSRPGHWDGREDRRQAGQAKAVEAAAIAHRAATAEVYADLVPVVTELHAQGTTLQAIADELNAQGHTTRRGKPWGPMQVMRLLRRAG